MLNVTAFTDLRSPDGRIFGVSTSTVEAARQILIIRNRDNLRVQLKDYEPSLQIHRVSVTGA